VVGCGLALGVVAFLLFPFLGVLVIAMTPAAAIMGIGRHLYGNQVTIGQMIVSFFETILWMLPLLLWDLIWFAIDKALDKDSGVCALCLLAYFIQAYFFAGFCEEVVKYLVIARLTNSRLTQDWRSMMMYGICSGAGFASLENLLYVAQYGVATGIVRGFVSVPLHCTTGAIIGLKLANKRPVAVMEGQCCVQSNLLDNACAYLKIVPEILLFPWLIHGTFDFCLMVSSGADTQFSFIGFIVAFFVFLAGVGYARHLALYTLSTSPAVKVNIHNKIITGDPPIIGENRISACVAGSTNWVCDCFFICSCCCRSNMDDLEKIRAQNQHQVNMMSSHAPIDTGSNPHAHQHVQSSAAPPYQGQNQVGNSVVYVHTV